MSTLSDLLGSASKQLMDSDSARLDAELIMCEVLGCDRVWLFTWPDHRPESDQVERFQGLIVRRIAGEPVAHILARREFWGLSLECNKHTLIPRPETELLVETALSLELPDSARILDLGTGTGAIALALASERPSWHIVAIDLVAEAIDLARRNADNLDLNAIDWRSGSWFEPLAGDPGFDLIVSNPPYVEEQSPWLRHGDVRFEPRSALTSGVDGMRDIAFIIENASNYLNSQGTLLIEHGFEQADLIRNAYIERGYSNIELLKDLAGLDRATLAKKAG